MVDTDPSADDKGNTADPISQDPATGMEYGAEAHKNHPGSGQPNTGDQGNPPSAHSLKILLKGHSLLEWIEAILAFILAVVGIFYTFYAEKQWQAMKDALDKTDTALEYNRQALELNRQGLLLNNRQTIANETSATVAGDSLKSSAAAFQIDQRPYMVANEAGWVVGFVPGSGSRVHWNTFFKNIGKTPAKSVRMYGCMIPVDTKLTETEIARRSDIIFAAAKAVMFSRRYNGADRAPSEGSFETIALSSETCQPTGPLGDFEMTTDQGKNWLSGNLELLTISGATYLDSFGRKHETRSCLLLTPRGEPQYCLGNNLVR